MNTETHRGPHPGILAIIFTGLFITGLSFVISFTTGAHYPGPWEPIATIHDYFRTQSHDVLMCAFFQFGSAIPLGLLTAVFVSRLQFLGNRAPGVFITLFGGMTTAISILVSSSMMWVLAFPGVAEDIAVTRALYYMGFAIGGVGYSVPLGLLIAGVSVTSAFMKVLPRWIWISGLAIAVMGQLSWFNMIFPGMLPLIPLTRFPGFIWLIIAGFALPQTHTRHHAQVA
jgi:hypothetical protein